MKRIALIVASVLVMGLLYLVFDDYSFDPLRASGLKKVFNGDCTAKKICSKDLIGFSIRGEYFDVYRYDMHNCAVDTSEIVCDIWENHQLRSSNNTVKWKNCPPDSITTESFRSILSQTSIDAINCSELDLIDLDNSDNFYLAIDDNYTRQFFLLFSPEIGHLIYVRKNGM